MQLQQNPLPTASQQQPAPEPPLRTAPRVSARTLVLLAVGAGAALRVLQYAARRALWLDEAVLFANLKGSSWGALLRPLRFGQVAPLGFLAAEKSSIAALGTGEYALRLLPLLAGLAALAAFVPLARRVLPRGAVPFAAALFALSPFLIYYSSELKQYSLDVLLSVLLLGLGAAVVERGLTPGRAMALLGVGAAGVWFSQPVIFVMAGVGLTLAAGPLRRRDARALALLAVVAAAWLASFAGSYLAARHTLDDPAYMHAFWRSGFMPLPPRTGHDWIWLPERVLALFRDPLGVTDDSYRATSWLHPLTGLACFALGAVFLARRRPALLSLLGLPFVLLLAAAAAQQYPFGGAFTNGGRVLLFIIPPAFLLMAAGAEWLRQGMDHPRPRVRRTLRVAAFAAMAVLLFPFARYAALGVPQVREETPPLLAYARERWQPGDVLYVYYTARPAFEYYRSRYGFESDMWTGGICARLDPLRYLADLTRLQGRRAWLLFVDGRGAYGFDERGLMLGYLDHVGRRLDDAVSVGASLYLYDLRRPFAAAGQYRAAVPHLPAGTGGVDRDCRGPWEPW